MNLPPPSAPERDRLKAARKSDIPRPAPSLQPKGLGVSAARRPAHDRAINREKRIQSIDTSLAATKGRAKTSFAKIRGEAFKPAPSKAPAKSQSRARTAFNRSR